MARAGDVGEEHTQRSSLTSPARATVVAPLVLSLCLFGSMCLFVWVLSILGPVGLFFIFLWFALEAD